LRLFGDVRNVGPSFTEFDPIYGKTLKSNLDVIREAPEFKMHMKTNSLEFRGSEQDKQTQTSILFLGDSFTMGYGVNDGEEFPALVKTEIEAITIGSPFSVVNAGISGAGTGRWIKFLRNELAALEPRLVVLQMLNNDFEDNLEENLFSVDEYGNLKELPIRKPKMRHIQEVIDAVPLLDHSHLYGFLKERLWFAWSRESKEGVEATKEDSAGDELTYRILESAIGICKKRTIPVLVLLIDIEGAKLERVLKILERMQADFMKLPSRAERPDLYYDIDGHWNKKGHAHAAEKIIEAVRARYQLW
jgi:hypothetical protein